MEDPPRHPAAVPMRRGLSFRCRPERPAPPGARAGHRRLRTSPPIRSGDRRPAAGGVAGGAATALALLLSAVLDARPSRADEPLGPPTGEVLLVVTGDISRPNVGAEAHLDRAHLESLPRERFTTVLPWAKQGSHEFEGPRLDALLEAVGAPGHRFVAHAADDYTATFEGVDLERYPIILADTRDGVPMTVRSLGPLRIVFPIDDHPELRTETNKAIAVWQLVGMHVP